MVLVQVVFEMDYLWMNTGPCKEFDSRLVLTPTSVELQSRGLNLWIQSADSPRACLYVCVLLLCLQA